MLLATSVSRLLRVLPLLLVVLGACGSDDEPSAAEPSKTPAVATPVDAEPLVTTPPVEKPVDAGKVDASPPTCLQQLADKGIAFQPATARGVIDAVKISGDIGGVEFVREDTDTINTDPMACSFVLTLERFAQILKAKGVTKVGSLGSYCYRCCCAWSETNDCRSTTDPEPNCGSNGYSNHSWGRAIDVRYLTMQNGTVLDINKTTHWLAGSSSSTCSTGLSAQTGVSKTLYSIVCETAAQKVFKTILTPNYNSAHRNHWHMDTGDSGTVSGTSVRSWEPTPVDVSESGDVCGTGGT